jgi:hypothetical protein
MTPRTLVKLTLAAWFCFSPLSAFAAPPVVKTVPWVASNPLIPHDTFAGKAVKLKGTSDVQGANIQYSWDFGDGSPVAAGTVTNRFAIEATHTYAGAAGTVFTARLTVQDTNTGETGSREYYVVMQTKALPVEVNVAIDEGLWFLHKAMARSTVGGVDFGDWLTCPVAPCNASASYYALTAANTHAFLVNGHSEDGASTNPYTETVARAFKKIFQILATTPIPASQTNPRGTFNPDTNANGYGVLVNQFVGSYEFYQGGSFMDAIVAAGTPAKVTTTGQAPSGANPGILGRTYGDIVQDMADYYGYCQYDGASGSLGLGGWRYSCNSFPDNSANQWAAIGLIPAERNLGYPTPGPVKAANTDWTLYSQEPTSGYLGYTSSGPIWGPYATTPSGMVQMVWTGHHRGDVDHKWDKAESYIRDNFSNTGGAGNAIKDYYYGMFSFTKSMLLYDANNDGVADPLHMLHSTTAGINDLDWYAAEKDANPETDNNTDGVARTLIGDQNVAGYWYGHNFTGEQYYFETGWAIIMLNRTLFESGAPVAVADATPNPAVAGQNILLNGGDSFHQDPTKSIDSWEWDLDNNGTFETTGVTANVSFGVVGDYIVRLRVTDDATPEASATTTLTIRVNTPPVAPTASAGGPYNFCPATTPWFLNGSGSNNPDEGQSEPGQPPNTIIEYSWDLPPAAGFGDALGANPNVTAQFTALGVGSYLVQLRVTDNTAASYPSSGMGNLSDTDSAQVVVRSATDPACACVDNLVARPKLNKAELSWTPRAGAHHYNIYRGTISGGPYLKIAEAPGTSGFFLDQGPLVVGSTYYYVVREAQANLSEVCQSNQAAATASRR